MYFIVFYEPTGERVVYLNEKDPEKITVKGLIEWASDRFGFDAGSAELGNRRLSLMYNSAQLQPQWFIQDISIRFGATVKCVVIEGVYLTRFFLHLFELINFLQNTKK